jgi:pimeloyl-ACP methyl ester carboxylesterase
VLVERLRRDGVALAYTEAGSGAPPLLLLHCWCGDHTHWLRGPDYQEVQRRYAEEFFLSTDAAHLKARLIAGLSSPPSM